MTDTPDAPAEVATGEYADPAPGQTDTTPTTDPTAELDAGDPALTGDE